MYSLCEAAASVQNNSKKKKKNILGPFFQGEHGSKAFISVDLYGQCQKFVFPKVENFKRNKDLANEVLAQTVKPEGLQKLSSSSLELALMLTHVVLFRIVSLR